MNAVEVMPIESRVERQLVERCLDGDVFTYRLSLGGTTIREARVLVPRGADSFDAGLRSLMQAA